MPRRLRDLMILTAAVAVPLGLAQPSRRGNIAVALILFAAVYGGFLAVERLTRSQGFVGQFSAALLMLVLTPLLVLAIFLTAS